MAKINIILCILFFVVGIISFQRKLNPYATIFIFSLSISSIAPLLPIFSSNARAKSNDPTIRADGTCTPGYQCMSDTAPGNIYVSSVSVENGTTAQPQGLGNRKCIPSECFNLKATTSFPKQKMWYPLACGTDVSQSSLETVYPNGICSLTASLETPQSKLKLGHMMYEDINGSTCDKDLLNVGIAVYKSCGGDCDKIPSDRANHNDFSTLEGMSDVMTNKIGVKDTPYAQEMLKSLKIVPEKYGGALAPIQPCKLIDTINSQKTSRYVTDYIFSTSGLREEDKFVYSCPTDGYYDAQSVGSGGVDICAANSNNALTNNCGPEISYTGDTIATGKKMCREYRKFCNPLESGSISYFTDATFNNVNYVTKDGKTINSMDAIDSSGSPYSCGVATENKVSGGTSSTLWVSNKPECKKDVGDMGPPAEYTNVDKDNKYSIKCVGSGKVNSCGFQYANATATYHAGECVSSCDGNNCGNVDSCGYVCRCAIGQTCTDKKCVGTACFDNVRKLMNIYSPDNSPRISAFVFLKSKKGVYFRPKSDDEIAYTLEHTYVKNSGNYPYPVTIYMWSRDGGKNFNYYFRCIMADSFRYDNTDAEIYPNKDGKFFYSIRSSQPSPITSCGFQILYSHDNYNDYVKIT
jgi:hypothetical protein